ncbi:hypothetical protein J7337_001882 [Fusarium musae]|uniref:Fungal N-terminal domain-containing protein n=1 Tax=Fusarium musae TaxID=1042133 RepID=A0A9P8DUF2_9HYPO|nr:hypothetical protein J7337_001882 [Fusarium musae]KAG9508318.1 hypothetical protein J7337_001882 [Fusarium musae]
MADPLSVAGLALAVVSLGLQVTGGIAEYFDSLKSRGQDIDSITRQNDTLRKTLRIIELSISQFQNDHKTATEALRQFLDSSNGELKVLESMIATFIIDDEGTAGRRNKARNQGSEKLATLQATSQIISRDLLVVQSEVSSIRTPIRGIETTLSQFETRFSGLENLLGQLFVQGSAINETLQECAEVIV